LVYKRMEDVADIMVGLVLRRKEADIGDEKTYNYKSLTLKSFNSEGWVNKKYLDDYDSVEELDDRYLTLKGDVIIRLTNPYTAITITKETEGYVVPSQFIIIRINSKEIISEYLSLYLNTEKLKRLIFVNAVGVTVPMIKTGTLRDLSIPIIDKNKQSKVAEISKLIIKERHMLYKLISEKEKYYEALTEAIIMEEERNE